MTSAGRQYIFVRGIRPPLLMANLRFYFETKQLSGGGTLSWEDCHIVGKGEDGTDTAVLKFVNAEDAEGVVQKSVHRIPVATDGSLVEVKVSWYGDDRPSHQKEQLGQTWNVPAGATQGPARETEEGFYMGNYNAAQQYNLPNAGGTSALPGLGSMDVATSSLMDMQAWMSLLHSPFQSTAAHAFGIQQENAPGMSAAQLPGRFGGTIWSPPQPAGVGFARAPPAEPDLLMHPSHFEQSSPRPPPPDYGAIGPSVYQNLPGARYTGPPQHALVSPGLMSFGTEDERRVSLDSQLTDEIDRDASVVIPMQNIGQLSDEAILLYFSQKSHGKVVESGCHFDRDKGTGTITISSIPVAKALVSERYHLIKGHRVELCRPRKEAPKVLDTRRLILRAEAELTDVPTETLLSYIKNRAGIKKKDGQDPKYEYSENKMAILVTFQHNIQDIEKLIEQIGKRPTVREIRVNGEKVYCTNWALVENLTEAIKEEDLRFHFEELDDIEEEQILEIQVELARATVQFSSHEVLDVVLQQSHELHGQVLAVKPYYPELRLALSRENGILQIEVKPFKMDIKRLLLEFLLNNKLAKSDLEKAAKNCDGYVNWPARGVRQSSILIAPTLREGAPAPVKRLWAQRTEVTLRKQLANYQTDSRPKKPTLLQHLREILKELNQEGVSIKTSDDGTELYVTGEKSAVKKAWVNLETALKRKDEQLQAMQAPKESVLSLGEEWQLDILQMSGYLHNLTSRFPSLTWKKDEQSVTLNGETYAVDEATKGIEDLWSGVKKQEYKKPKNFLHFIQSEPVKNYMMDMLWKQEIVACYSSGDVCTLYARTEGELDSAVKQLDSALVFHMVNQTKAMDEERLRKETAKIMEEHQGMVSITMEKAAHSYLLTLSALKDVHDTALQNLHTALENVSLTTKHLQMPGGQVRYTFAYMQTDIAEIQTVHHVHMQKQGGGIVVEGAKCILANAFKDVKTLMMTKIKVGELSLRKPGMKQYYQNEEGVKKLSAIEHRLQCIIDSSLPEAPVTDHSDEEEFVPCATRKLFNGRQIILCKGDMTRQNVDVIVNAANERLEHIGGLARAIADAGGPVIQQESRSVIERHVEVLAGEIAVTNAGNLPCNKVIHAVGPIWNNGRQQEKKKLRSCVNKSLRKAEELGHSSIAVPAISGGIYGYPIKQCTHTIVQTVYKYLTECTGSLTEVRLIDTNEASLRAFKEAIQNICGEEGEDDGNSWNQEDGDIQYDDDMVGAVGGVGFPDTDPDEYDVIMTPSNMKISLVIGAIQRQKVDVVVNSTQTSGTLNSGGVSQAICRAGGPDLQQEFDTQMAALGRDLLVGDFIVTGPADMVCKRIYHVFMINYDRKTNGKEAKKTLCTIVYQCLQNAEVEGFKSISFPAIGTGGLGVPAEVVADVLLREIQQYSSVHPNSSLSDVRVVVYEKDDKTIKAFKDGIKKAKGGSVFTGAGTQSSVKVTKRKSIQSEQRLPADKSGLMLSNLSRKGGELQVVVADRLCLQVRQGDITQETTDCIVNSTNEALELNRGAVSKAIAQKAGRKVQLELRKLRRPDDRGIAVTTGGNLPCHKIIHVVLPSNNHLKDAVVEYLNTAEQLQLSSIAFPLLGAGLQPQNVQTMAQALLGGIQEFALQDSEFLVTVRIVIFQPGQVNSFCDMVKRAAKWQTPISQDDGQQPAAKPKNLFQRFGSWMTRALTGPTEKESARETSAQSRQQINDIVQFKIYAGSEERIDEVKKEIESDAQSVCRREAIMDPVVSKLIAREEQQILAICNTYNVEIQIDREDLERILVTGPTNHRLKAVEMINAVLRDAQNRIHEQEKEELVAATVQWYYVEDDGEYVEFPTEINAKIEKLRMEGGGSYNFKNEKWRLQLDGSGMKGQSVSPRTGKSVDIVRRDVMDEIPVHWGNRGDEEFRIVNLPNVSAEYKEVELFFNQTIVAACSSINSIERIENPALYKQYCAKKESLEKKLPAGTTFQVEQRLFHGTGGELCDKINQQGFNRSFNTQGVYGQGVYFARHAEYSARDGYSKLDANGTKHMYVCDVLVGEYTTGRQEMKEPPVKSGLTLYDSVVDNPANPTIFVIFHDSAAYPTHLIKFLG